MARGVRRGPVAGPDKAELPTQEPRRDPTDHHRATAVETHYGGNDLDRYAEEIEVEYDTLRRYRDVARAYESAARAANLSYRHHHEVARRHLSKGQIAMVAAKAARVQKLNSREAEARVGIGLYVVLVAGAMPRNDGTSICPGCGARLETASMFNAGEKGNRPLDRFDKFCMSCGAPRSQRRYSRVR